MSSSAGLGHLENLALGNKNVVMESSDEDENDDVPVEKRKPDSAYTPSGRGVKASGSKQAGLSAKAKGKAPAHKVMSKPVPAQSFKEQVPAVKTKTVPVQALPKGENISDRHARMVLLHLLRHST